MMKDIRPDETSCQGTSGRGRLHLLSFLFRWRVEGKTGCSLREELLYLAPVMNFVDVPRKLEPSPDKGSSNLNVLGDLEDGSRLFDGIREGKVRSNHGVKAHITKPEQKPIVSSVIELPQRVLAVPSFSHRKRITYFLRLRSSKISSSTNLARSSVRCPSCFSAYM